ncbi:MAG: type II toxin-antitoxin system RelE/ParE family toxin [Proteobacteria bacterium]|nr:type II toxin-antitoxin system RelE/ParE family toxin [Pseudomonadota bacterium]
MRAFSFSVVQFISFEEFLNKVFDELAAAICKKIYGFVVHDDIYIGNRIKILKPKIWGYKGTIYKLRVYCGKESPRVLFVKTPHNDIVLLHGFIKKTRKTPKKDAEIAIRNLERLKNKVETAQLPLAKYLL